MKIKFLLILFICGSGLYLFKTTSIESVISKNKNKILEQFERSSISKTTALLANTSDEVATVDMMKAKFEIKDEFEKDIDIEAAIEKRGELLKVNHLIEKANSNSLSKADSYLLLTVMRERMALNQILLDRKMKKFERKYL